MYYDYFGLSHPPFKITPDTRLFFPGGKRGAVLQALVYAITNGEGIIKVVGEVGSGKTMLCRMLEESLPKQVEIVYLANPSLTPDNLLHAIAFEMKLDVEPEDPQLKVMHKIQDYLVDQHAKNRRIVMFVEEAQSMPIETLEEMRLLSNLETKQDKLLQIVLFGQPELDENLSEQHIRQLKERITYSFNLAPLQEYEVRDYINTRLRVSGYQNMDLFNPKAVREIWKHSGGLLRRINILCDKSCLAAFAENDREVVARHVRTAINDSDFSAMPRGEKMTTSWLAALALIIIAAIGGGAWWFEQSGSAVETATLNEGLSDDTRSQHADDDPVAAADQPVTVPAWQKLDQETKNYR